MTPEQKKTLNSVAICVEALLQLVHPDVLKVEVQKVHAKVHAKMAAAQEKARLDAAALRAVDAVTKYPRRKR